MNGKTSTGGNGGGFGRRWWERMFAGVLILIGLVAAVIFFLIMARGYCACRTWDDWSAGLQCPEGCISAQTPTDWNQDALLFCRKQLGSYGSTEVNDLAGATQFPTVHERYFVYQAPNAAEVYFFLAVQASSYGDPSQGAQGSAVKLDVMRTDMGSPYSSIPVSCSGPRLISEATTSTIGASSDRTWGWYCRVSNPQGGFPGPGGFAGYRVFVKNVSPQPLRYCYVAVCDRKYPKNDRCTDPAVALQITPPRGGYPSSGYPSSGYPSSGYPSSTYPSSSPPAYSPPYPSSGYPTSPAGTPSSSPSTGGAGK